MTVRVIKFGKARRLRSISQLRHLPSRSNRRKGKWQNRAALWKYKKLARRKRLIAKASRRRNRCRV